MNGKRFSWTIEMSFIEAVEKFGTNQTLEFLLRCGARDCDLARIGILDGLFIFTKMIHWRYDQETCRFKKI